MKRPVYSKNKHYKTKLYELQLSTQLRKSGTYWSVPYFRSSVETRSFYSYVYVFLYYIMHLSKLIDKNTLGNTMWWYFRLRVGNVHRNRSIILTTLDVYFILQNQVSVI
jgi:hypothetical protein